ncbi:chemotaxis protein CheW [Pseudoneobacillus sp. C159]
MSETLTQEVETWEEDTQKGKFLTFFVENECYGIEIKHVTEIIGIQKITEIPEMPDFLRGIINLRGKIIPVMDVRLRFKKMVQEYNDRTCIIVIDIHECSIGLIVDRVSEVLSISDSQIVAPPEINHNGNKYVMGIGKVGNDVKLLLDCEKLLKDGELQQVQNI